MRHISLTLALMMAGAIASTPSFAELSPHERNAYEATGSRGHARDLPYREGKDAQINHPRTLTGPELVNKAPFRSES